MNRQSLVNLPDRVQGGEVEGDRGVLELDRLLQGRQQRFLVANLMIAIGGSPAIDSPGFVPLYPGSLPGGLAPGLIVRLRRCSIAQLRDVFMVVEQPQETEEPVDGQVDPEDPEQRSRFTIGWFYDEIERSLDRLADQRKITFGEQSQEPVLLGSTNVEYIQHPTQKSNTPSSTLKNSRAPATRTAILGDMGKSTATPRAKKNPMRQAKRFGPLSLGFSDKPPRVVPYFPSMTL